MKKLIKADLCDVLRLTPIYQPITRVSIETDIVKLCRCEYADYLFLARREKSFLCGLTAVYQPGTYENIMWQSWRGIHHIPVIALHLHITKVLDARPWGSVTLLDYQTAAEDVETFCVLPEPERKKHVRDIIQHFITHARFCTMLDLIQYLKTGEVNPQWI